MYVVKYNRKQIDQILDSLQGTADIAEVSRKINVASFKGVFNDRTAKSDFKDIPGVWWDETNHRFFKVDSEGNKSSTWGKSDVTDFASDYYGELISDSTGGRQPDTSRLFICDINKTIWWYNAISQVLYQIDKQLFDDIDQINLNFQQLQQSIASVINLIPEIEVIDSTTKLDGGVPYFGIPIVEQSDAVAEIEPNVLNRWGEVASLTLNFKEGKPNCVGEYMVEFVSGSTATTLSLPSDVKFPYEVEIEPNMRYQLSVINNVGLITCVEL